MGVLFESPNDFSIIQNTFNVELKKQNDDLGFFANPYVYQYPNANLDIGLRELYVDFFSNKLNATIKNSILAPPCKNKAL